MTSKTKRFLPTIGIVTALMMPFGNAFAQSGNLSELTAQWWQWAASIPTTVNPLLDTTGGNCVVGQRGSLWFLAGSFSGGSATRQCSVPEGTALFFPVANSVTANSPNVCGQGPANFTVKELRAQIAASVNGFSKLEADVDGTPSSGVVLVQSEPFSITLPADNLFNAPCGGVTGRSSSPRSEQFFSD